MIIPFPTDALLGVYRVGDELEPAALVLGGTTYRPS